MKKFISLLLILSPLLAFAQKTVDQRVEEILSRMTIEDKLGQLNQMDGRRDIEKIKQEVREGTLSSIMNIVDPAVTDELQRIAIEESPESLFCLPATSCTDSTPCCRFLWAWQHHGMTN